MSTVFERVTRKTLRRITARTAAHQTLHGSEADIFDRTWRSLFANPFYRFAIRLYSSANDSNAEQFKILIRTCPDLFQSVKICAPQHLVDMLQSDATFIAVQIHDGAPNLTKFVVDHQRRMSRIVRDPWRHLKELQSLGLETAYVDLIERNVNSFSRLREAVYRRQVICCAIDFKDSNGTPAYLSPSIFAFAQRFELPIVYTKHDVDQHGRVQLWASPPAMVSDPIEATLAFQTFYNSLPGKRVNLTIKKYVDEKANCSDRITTGVMNERTAFSFVV